MSSTKTKRAPMGAMNDDTVLGERIRSRRRINGMTLQELADAVGRSIGYVSQIERGMASPPLATIYRICEALEMPVSWLLSEGFAPGDPSWIIRAGNRRQLEFPASGLTKELLTSDSGGQLQLIWLRFKPNGSSGTEPWYHQGEAAGTVMSGELEVTWGSGVHVLRVGDTFRFKGDTPHRFRNISDGETELLIVVTPPHY